MLGERVVHGDDRILERAVLGHGAQANDAGGGLLGTADYVGHQIEALGDQRGDEVGTIVHGDLRLIFQCGTEMRVIRGIVLALDGKSWDVVVLHQAGRDFILRRERI